MKCKSTNSNGRPCQAKAQADSDFCFFHDAEVSERRRNAQSRGGRGHRRTLAVLPEMELDFTNLEMIPAILSFVVKGLLERRLDAKTGHAVCHAIHLGLRLNELSTVRAQMERIESLLEAERNREPHQSAVEEIMRFAPEEPIETSKELRKTRTDLDAGRN